MLTLAAWWGVSACSPGGGEETVALGLPPLEQNSLIYTAIDRGFFTRQGLKITVKNYDTGVTAINGLLSGEIDIAASAEFPVVRAGFRNDPVSIIACSDKFQNDYILGMKARGIQSIADLKGKKIGVAKQTIAEFFLGRFLSLQGISPRDVTTVDVPPARFAEALDNNEVDAITAWQPYVYQIEARNPGAISEWSAQSDQSVFGVLVCHNKWLPQRAETINKFLTALADAEIYVFSHAAETKSIVKNTLSYDDAYINAVWREHQFGLSLDLAMVIAMNDEGRWMIGNNLTPGKNLPDFKSMIYTDGLKGVKPEAVDIIR